MKPVPYICLVGRTGPSFGEETKQPGDCYGLPVQLYRIPGTDHDLCTPGSRKEHP